MDNEHRPDPRALLRDLPGGHARLVLFIGASPGAGKTYRLLTEACSLHGAGVRVVVGSLETKGRADLERLAAPLPRIPPRKVEISAATFDEFDLDAALAAHPDVVILDELAHANLPGSRNPKRWQDALELRAHGIGVLASFNVQHLEDVAPAAERVLGYPVREIIPREVVDGADDVIGVDTSPELLEQRLRSGKIVGADDIERARAAAFRPSVLRELRRLLLASIEPAAQPSADGARRSSALVIAPAGADPRLLLRYALPLADALGLALEVALPPQADRDWLHELPAELHVRALDWRVRAGECVPLAKLDGTLVVVPAGRMAAQLVSTGIDRDVLVVGNVAERAEQQLATEAGSAPAERVYGSGTLTIYLGAAAGCGKTYAMLDRAHQLKDEGIDVVAALVETHGRRETEAKLEGLEVLPRLLIETGGATYREVDRGALMRRHPQVALIDELAHTNPPGSPIPKRYQDVLSILQTGISVMTTLNIQHLEGLAETVYRLTGVHVREQLPDRLLEVADELILVDATPELLRTRLREGKIYPPERIELALSKFFRTENLAALRELAIREIAHARQARGRRPPFTRVVLGVSARERDVALIRRCASLADRLGVAYSVVHVAPSRRDMPPVVERLREAARQARAHWNVVIDERVSHGLARIAKSEGTLMAVEGVRGRPPWPWRRAFARLLLDEGVENLMVLAPAPAGVPAE